MNHFLKSPPYGTKAFIADELALPGHGIEPDDYANVSSRSIWNEWDSEHLYGFVESLVGMLMMKQ
jgi:hypothetical protein